MEPSGRLALSWTGKDRALLSTPDGGYEWVSRDDPRLVEVRLLHDTGTAGSIEGDDTADNLIIRGDSYHALHALSSIPEFARHYLGKVKLVYIDPPFNTKRTFQHYDDSLEHSVWLTMMRDRLVRLKSLLAPDGSIYVHCDAAESHYLKVVMDEVFGRANFRTEIVWKRTTAHSDAKTWGQICDSIFFYTKSSSFTWNPPYSEHSEEYVASKYRSVDENGRRYQLDNLTSPNPRPNMTYEWKGFAPPAFGWRYSKETMAKLDEEGRIWYPKDKSKRPRLKRFLDESKGKLLDNIWSDIPPVNSQAREDSGYDTQKPEKLLQRIIAASSDPGDIVLDCFAGSGSTAAAAHKMGRRWVVIEKESATVEKFTKPRLEAVVKGDDPGGITETVGWEKGGGFRSLEVGPSTYEMEGGRAYLAEWVSGDAFAEVVRVQLGYTADSCPPFTGRRGRTRLAVVDGVVDENVVIAVVSRLDDGERVVLVAKAIVGDAGNVLKQASPGSRLLKAPNDLLARRNRR